MRLAIVHYHLRKGGVTRVIASAVQALQARGISVAVLSSTASEEELACPVGLVPELAYASEVGPGLAGKLFQRLQREARHLLGADPDVWHLHNHGLGKNVHMPEALRLLIGDGARVLLQIHDFAEDGRPTLYQAQRRPYEEGRFPDYDGSLYPIAPQVAYAVLNGRDQAILRQAGVPSGQLHWLPNAVSVPDQSSPGRAPAKGGKPLILYPTRAIRRKNLGELLLMASAYPEFRYATTLSPNNPEWAPTHAGWVKLARELRLPVRLGLGEEPGQSFPALVAEARALITTSVGEGFGLAFLEPWLFGKPVLGRDLPEITADFKDRGIALPDLYPDWKVPLRWLDAEALRARFVSTARSVYAAYGRSVSESALAGAWKALTADREIDMAALDEAAQEEVLRSLAEAGSAARLKAPVDPAHLHEGIVGANRERITSLYGLDKYGQQLVGIYTALREASPAEPAKGDASRVLDAFLDPQRLRLLRT